jgi:peptide methionine sulfoxide reductase msrA/msrB
VVLLAALAALGLGWFAWQARASQGRAASQASEAQVDDSKHCKRLTPEEERVIVKKGTERPFSGEYWDHHEDGTYTCKRCGAELFKSDAKFDSGTGWPSFDETMPGAVREVTDADGFRTEIVCAGCGAHLGHVFKGEGFTEKGVRHCVNSVSLGFQAKGRQPATAGTGAAAATQEAFFAGGCFWGVEYWFDKEPGVLIAESGYMGGRTSSPTYKQVCGGSTGHVETVRIVFDPAKTSYERLAKLFFEIHDPTQVDRQGPDVGEQYRSVVFYANDGQKRDTEKLVAELSTRGYKVATKIEPAGQFWKAEDYHQDYYDHKGSTPYCHTRVRRFEG